MTQVHAIRPLGESDLAALRNRFDTLFAAWAQGWLAAGAGRVVSVRSCTAGAAVSDVWLSEAGVLLTAEAVALLWAPRVGLAQLGRACVLEGDKLLGDTRLDDVMADLGRGALDELVRSLVECPADASLSKVSVDALVPDDFGWDGVQATLQIGSTDVNCFFPRTVLTSWLTPLQTPAQRLRPIKLPASLGNTLCGVTAWSRPFDVLASDLLGLSPGNVLTMDQRLDTAFELRIPAHPELTLKAFPGRSGQALAVEVFQN